MQDRQLIFLDRNLSVYLDLARVIAAVSVVLGHMDTEGLYASWLPLSDMSHESVIYFFVLSGLVISTSVMRRENEIRSYLIARLSRIYSVVVPAIVLSFLIKGIATYFSGGEMLGQYLSGDLSILNVIGSVLFLNESWGMPSQLPWNDPFWSLCYEVWFYVLFGMAVFTDGRRRLMLIGIGCLIAGPSIIVMFPIWLLGVWMAKNGQNYVPKGYLAIAVWILSLAVIKAISDTGFDVAVRLYLYEHIPGYWRLENAQRFPTDYLIGICVVANILAFRGLSDSLGSILDAIRAKVVYLAGLTFSIYLYHRPFAAWIGHSLPNVDKNHLLTLLYLMGILLICMALGSITERKRDVISRILQGWLGEKRPAFPVPGK